jgi:hypothetical protein
MIMAVIRSKLAARCFLRVLEKVMIKRIFISLLICMPTLFAANAKDLEFGRGVDMSKVESISTILAKPEAFVDQQVTVNGTITAVCKNRGCWMELTSDKRFGKLRIKVKDGDMVFPVSTKGRKAYATGKLTEKTLNKQQTINHLRHMAQDANQPFDEASVTQGMVIYQLTPTGVTISG